jgi:enediyne biosynthesis protein E4
VTRIVAIVLITGLLFVAGYGMTDFVQQRRIWRDDVAIRQSTIQTSSARTMSTTELPDSGVRFVNVAADVGVDFTYYDGAEGKYHLVETTGGGMAVLDVDGDGYQDVFFVNGSRLPVKTADARITSKLYRNRSERGMDDITAPAGVALVAYGQGAAAGDYDNDGFEDLIVTCFGRCVAYHSNGDGTFSDVSDAAGVQSNQWCTSAALADLDQDGALDLYVCAYGTISIDHAPSCERGGRRMHCLPSMFPAEPDLLFRNAGDGAFVESSVAAGVCDSTGRGLGVAIADFDGDDHPDVFVANDTSENFLFLQRQPFRFDESALSRGVALTGTGATMSGMGVACGDYDLNGWLDLFVTNFYQERSVLYQNMGTTGFVDSADATGVGALSRDRLGFGTMFLDANLDGLPDLFVANGHISDMTPFGVPYKMRQQFFVNDRGKTFRDSSNWAGPYFHEQLLGRGAAAADFNNDGLPDLVVSHILDPAAILINRTKQHGHWLGLQLIGTSANRDGTNAKVIVELHGEARPYELIAGGGYLSSSDKRCLVGTGELTDLTGVRVRWSSGRVQDLGPLQLDQYHYVREPVKSK